MTFEMKQTRLLGYTFQYGPDVVINLNQAYAVRNPPLNNNDLRDIGRRVFPFVEHRTGGKTEDGYFWFGTLEFQLDSLRVAVLFPWTQDWDHPESQMDRSINVYSDRELDKSIIQRISDRVGNEIRIYKEETMAAVIEKNWRASQA